MKTPDRRRILQALAAGTFAAALAACGGSDPDPAMNVGADGLSSFDSTTLRSALASYPLQSISSAESTSLATMREEEMLAQAVYLSSASRWPSLPIFTNIAGAEATHTAAVLALLDRYGLADPLAGLSMGSFATQPFQDLYAQLVADSSASLIDALKVGVLIEEMDIHDLDLQKSLVDNNDILLVYDNLQRGSRNHLRAFMSVLASQGGSYVPQVLSQAEFDAIVNSPMEGGR
jgi:hypothetical protein